MHPREIPAFSLLALAGLLGLAPKSAARSPTVRNLIFALVVTIAALTTLAARAQPFGLSNRVANTTLRMPSAPPVLGYSLTDAFPGLTFTQPLGIVAPPGETNRLFILQKGGIIMVITNLANPTMTEFMRLTVITSGDDGLLDMAFHPGYATNRCFYVFATRNFTTTQATNARHMRVSRFETSLDNPNVGLTNSELPLFSQFNPSFGHHAGDLQFGPDGCLYVALGDGGPQRDRYTNSQTITKDFFSAILRLDVDKRPENLRPNPHPANTTNYFVPADNPFVGATEFNGAPVNPANVRTEFYAVGFRVPWRMTFDPPTGFLYVTDVGQDAWEELDIVVKGGNYGWAYREGLHAGVRTPPAGVTLIDPILEYGHGNGTNQGNSITGGIVYRGENIPDLRGWYVFADYQSGNVWRLRYNGTNATDWQRLLSDPGLVSFAADPSNGDVLAADVQEGRIKRLRYAPASGGLLPPTLADTGAFTNLTTLTPHAGILPYDLNVPFWSDGAHKRRWFSVTSVFQRITFRTTNYYTFPAGAVWIKHFELEMTNGVPESRRRLETRFLVRDNTASGVYGVTYRWGDSPDNATLVPEGGMDETFVIQDGGTVRTQIWRYPSRTECIVCHTPQARGVLGFNTPQLNRHFNYDGVTDNQLRALSSVGYFFPPIVISNLNSLPALAPPTDESVSLEYRVRSYLMANCSQCHQPGGSAQGNFNARIWTPLSSAGLIGGALFNDGGDTNNRVVTPGDLMHSMLHTRISTRGLGQMPPLASSLLDTQAIALVSRWIMEELPSYVSFASWQSNYFGSTNAPDALPNADPDNDGARNRLEWLTGTNPNNPSEVWQIGINRTNDAVQVVYPHAARRGFEVEWTTNPANPAGWNFLDVPDNRPFYPASNSMGTVTDPLTNGPTRFYRVRVYEP